MAIQARGIETATVPSPIAEQSSTTTFHVETMNDLDNGQSMLLCSTDPNLGDLQVATADQVIAKGIEAHRKIDSGVRLALAYEAAMSKAPTGEPHTWTAEEIGTGKTLTVSCMSGCNTTHEADTDSPSFAPEVSCISWDHANTTELPIDSGDGTHDGAVLGTYIRVDHFHPDPARHVPYANVEIVEDHYLVGLDPDGLAAVIDHYALRVAAMRLRHTELVRIRDEYLGRQA